MLRTRQFPTLAVVCSALLISGALAQTTLTQIQDTVLNPSGQPFNGTVVITWAGPQTPSGTTPSGTSVKIYNGALSVLIAPSITTATAGYYQATYNSSDGLVTWSEYWSVPATNLTLTLSQIRVQIQPSSPTNGSDQVSISQVPGLSAALSSLSQSINAVTANDNGITSQVSTLNTQVSALTTSINNLLSTQSSPSSSTATANFVDAEIPAGTISGSNAAFTLAQTPVSGASVSLYRNGILLAPLVDYTISASNITFAANSLPQTGDSLFAFYRAQGTGPSATFVDGETPSGAINGLNTAFMVANTPNPLTSLRLYRDGILLQQGIDYTIAGTQITVNQSAAPQTGDSLTAYYRH